MEPLKENEYGDISLDFDLLSNEYATVLVSFQ